MELQPSHYIYIYTLHVYIYIYVYIYVCIYIFLLNLLDFLNKRSKGLTMHTSFYSLLSQIIFTMVTNNSDHVRKSKKKKKTRLN